MAVFDCFSFFGSNPELDLLDLRLHELSDVVNYFVLVEATLTHSGMGKPLYYEQNKQRFKLFESQIIHIVVEDMPQTPAEIQAAITPQDRRWLDTGYQLGDDWVRERYQRNQIMRGLVDADPEDVIVIEDADEFVKPELLECIESEMVDGSNAIGQELRTYYLNWRCINMPWWGTKILRKKFISNPSEDRFHTPANKYFHNCGYHFGYLGGAEAIREKIQAFAHQEFMTPEVFRNIQCHLDNMTDALGRLYKYELIELNESNTPVYILQHPEIFGEYIYGHNH